MSNTPAELGRLISGDELGRKIAHLWNRWNVQRRPFIEEMKEQRNFIFATDTTKTSVGSNTPWKNSTTLPKLTQIRDNLHSNYLSALFPNDEWLKWEAYSKEDNIKAKKKAITAYMSNKLRDGDFRTTMSRLLYDYIDYGNAFCTVGYENGYVDEDTPKYIGPTLVRIAPEFIVFDLSAESFEASPKIIRSIKTMGELKMMAEEEPDNMDLAEAIARHDKISNMIQNYGIEDNDLAEGIQIDGFGNLQEYYQSNYVEVLEFVGDYHDEDGTLHKNKQITIIDRAKVIRDRTHPSWTGRAPVFHVGWRQRPNNLWAMGPLTNLVGMQYRIDHLENSKADAYDLAIHPPLVIQGEVDEFVWGPGCEIHIEEGGSVQEMARNIQWVLQANQEINMLENQMEAFAGAPREAMGIRSPGEKTAFEVQALENAAGRIFQEKITSFEVSLLEPVLNGMLETSRRNLDGADIIRVLDDDLGVTDFQTVTKEDISAKGKLRPIGARHFAAQAQMLQNLSGVFNSPIGQQIAPHTSSVALAKLIEDTLGLERFELFKPNVAVFEQQETARLAGQAEEDLAAEAGAATDAGI